MSGCAVARPWPPVPGRKSPGASPQCSVPNGSPLGQLPDNNQPIAPLVSAAARCLLGFLQLHQVHDRLESDPLSLNAFRITRSPSGSHHPRFNHGVSLRARRPLCDGSTNVAHCCKDHTFAAVRAGAPEATRAFYARADRTCRLIASAHVFGVSVRPRAPPTSTVTARVGAFDAVVYGRSPRGQVSQRAPSAASRNWVCGF